MAKKRSINKFGAWAFLVGVVLAVILGIFSDQLISVNDIIIAILVIAGILVGLFNVKSQDSTKFLWAALALVLVAYLGDNAISAWTAIPTVGQMLRNILSALLVLFVPTTIIVALRAVFELAKK